MWYGMRRSVLGRFMHGECQQFRWYSARIIASDFGVLYSSAVLYLFNEALVDRVFVPARSLSSRSPIPEVATALSYYFFCAKVPYR